MYFYCFIIFFYQWKWKRRQRKAHRKKEKSIANWTNNNKKVKRKKKIENGKALQELIQLIISNRIISSYLFEKRRKKCRRIIRMHGPVPMRCIAVRYFACRPVFMAWVRFSILYLVAQINKSLFLKTTKFLFFESGRRQSKSSFRTRVMIYCHRIKQKRKDQNVCQQLTWSKVPIDVC